MTPATTWGLVIGLAGITAAIFVAVDMWMDRRPGGRKRDEHLDRLRQQDAYRQSLRRIYDHQDREHVRIGRKDRP